MTKHDISLIISHSITLTRDERYSIHEGNIVQTIGISIPYWKLQNKEINSTKEIFCRYSISYTGKNQPIRAMDDATGYIIYLPFRDKKGDLDSISNEDWRKMSNSELEMWYANNKAEITSKVLLDAKDGGSEGIVYRESSRLLVDSQIVNVRHYISIKDESFLLNSLD